MYAKNMCQYCYHVFADNKRATKCPHTLMPHYARGFCIKCYFRDYNVRKAAK
jgi:hypothetical protein